MHHHIKKKVNVKTTCTWNNVTESSSICTRMASFFDPRPAVDADPSTPDGVLIECVIRLPDVEACDGAIFVFVVDWRNKNGLCVTT